jgi:hypothetical protein
MKTALVPAQITTVEDKIVAGMTAYQLVLVVAPLCAGFLAYAALPPNLHMALYKIGVVAVLEVVGLALSIQIRGRMVARWLVMILRYNARPRYYVYNKNDAYLRVISGHSDTTATDLELKEKVTPNVKTKPELTVAQMVQAESIMADPRAKLRFVKGKDGKLNAVINEIK